MKPVVNDQEGAAIMNFLTHTGSKAPGSAPVKAFFLLFLWMLAALPSTQAWAGNDARPARVIRLAMNTNVMPLKFLPMLAEPPAFTLPDLRTGKKMSLSDLHGKVTLVNFCNVHYLCGLEVQSLKKLRRKLRPRNVQVIVILAAEDVNEARDFVEREGVDFPVLHDEHEKVTKAWGVNSTPTTFVLDRKGRAVFVAFGTRDWMHPNIIIQLHPLFSPQWEKKDMRGLIRQ